MKFTRRHLGCGQGGGRRAIQALLLLLLLAGCMTASLPRHMEDSLEVTNDEEGVYYFKMRSELLSRFWGRDMFLEAGVVVPPARDRAEKLPVSYYVHGFGGSHRGAWRSGLGAKMRDEDAGYPRIIAVYPNTGFSLGHHIWADSVNNGPWGAAFTTEFVPAIEAQFNGYGKPEGRFLTGHSSGGHSGLWLQVNYPDTFGGVWSSAPDPVDFRDFIGVNIYADKNAYVDENGDDVMLIRRRGEWVTSLRAYTQRELEGRDYGGQMASFDAVFSPRGEDGRPMPLFDRATGAIDPFVAEAWKRYDISLILREHWGVLGPKLKNKIRIYVGTEDTFRLDGAVRLLAAELERLQSGAEIVFVEGRAHNVFAPHPELWPNGLMERVHREMRAQFDRSTDYKYAALGEPSDTGQKPERCFVSGWGRRMR